MAVDPVIAAADDFLFEIPPGPGGEDTPQDTRDREVPFRMGGHDDFDRAAELFG